MILADEQKVQSYPELLELAAQSKYKNKKFIEIMVLPAIMGG
jgi:hypothetical protein